MTDRTAAMPSTPEDSTIILPVRQEEYKQIVAIWQDFRSCIDRQYQLHPEIFPATFEKGYKLHDKKISKKTGVVTRRIKLRNGQVWTVHPGFVMPHMTGYTEEVAKGLYLRKFGVPYEALTYVFGKDDNYWYRVETRFGRKNIVATTVKTAKIPVNLLADEHHEKANGEKIYIATTVARGVVLGAEISASASKDDLQQAYGIFKGEALVLNAGYAPSIVNTDG